MTIIVAKTSDDKFVVLHNTTSFVLSKAEAAELRDKLIGVSVTPRRHKVTEEIEKQAITMYLEGKYSTNDIAKILQVSKGTITTLVTRHGIANRRPKQQERARQMQALRRVK